MLFECYAPYETTDDDRLEFSYKNLRQNWLFNAKKCTHCRSCPPLKYPWNRHLCTHPSCLYHTVYEMDEKSCSLEIHEKYMTGEAKRKEKYMRKRFSFLFWLWHGWQRRNEVSGETFSIKNIIYFSVLSWKPSIISARLDFLKCVLICIFFKNRDTHEKI